VLLEIHDEWQVATRRYLSEGSMALLGRKMVGRRRRTERERYWWRPGSDAIDTVAEHHDGSLTSHHPKGHGPVELAESGATVSAVCPVGAPDTGMGREALDFKVLATGRSAGDISAAAARTNPLGRNASPAEIASAIEFFLTDEAGFLTGNAPDVHGGARLGFLPGT
jgi:hypothetical protein